jgi:tetratricopeptide (TPR) repeat protein
MAEVPSELAAEVQKLERYHAENPQGRYFVPLANAYRKMAQVEQAEALLREGLRRHPDYLSAHIVLGRCLADRGAVEEAASEFRHVLSADPQNLIALRSLGELASEQGESGEAARWYRELLAVDPMNEEARSALESLEEAARPATPAADLSDDLMSWGEVRLDAEPPAAAPESGAAELPGEVEFGSIDLGEAEQTHPAPSAEPSPSPSGWDPVAEATIELGDGGEAEIPGAEPEGEEVVTETIADLYARQGFHDRAAEVYRELLRRGDDPELRRKLSEVEALAAGRTPAPEEPAAEEPTAEDLPLVELGEALPLLDTDFGGAEAPGGEMEHGAGEDPFASSFELGFGGAEAPAPAAGGDLAEAPAVGESFPAPVNEPAGAEPRAGGTVRDYFAGLLSWSRGGEAASATAAEPAAAEPEPASAAEPEPEAEPLEDLPWLAAPDAGLAAEDAEDVAPVEGLLLPEWEAGPEPPEPEAPPPASAAGDAGEMFPWELTAESPAAEQPTADRNVRDESSFSFEEFFTPPPAAPAPEPRADAPQAPAPAEREQPAQPAADAGGEDDEDLESFQAWLQSLKR